MQKNAGMARSHSARGACRNTRTRHKVFRQRRRRGRQPDCAVFRIVGMRHARNRSMRMQLAQIGGRDSR